MSLMKEMNETFNERYIMFLPLFVCCSREGGVGFPACVTGQMTSGGRGAASRVGLPTWGSASGGGQTPSSPGTREAGGTHPTGKLSCCKYSQCQSSEAGNY